MEEQIINVLELIKNGQLKEIDDIESELLFPFNGLLNNLSSILDNPVKVSDLSIEELKKVLPDFDINIILGNLLDNAVHALSLCSNKKLYIKIKYEPGILHIVIKNTFKEENKKNTSEEHGLGLFSVENTVKKYKGVFAHSQKNDIYTANLILYI